MDMRPSSPARLHEAGNQALGAELAHRNAAHLELAVKGARTAGDLAAIAHADLRGVARQLGELERRREALLHGHGLVHRDLLQPRAASRVLLREPRPPLVLLDRTGLRHSASPGYPRLRWLAAPHCRNGKLKAASSARASSSFFAVVQTTMSMPSVD